MKQILFPYGKKHILHAFEEQSLAGVLTSAVSEYDPGRSGKEIVRLALANPVASPMLCELAKGKKRIVIIASDHTRPVPSRIIIPAMLAEIRRTNPDAQVTILIATGCHRAATYDELVDKFGPEIVAREKILIHDCDDRSRLRSIGTLPSGGDCEINTLALDADLLLAEGFIEPHFFAGYSGGRKSVLPGIASRETVLANHCSEFIDDVHARTGVLEGNPIHRDMLWAAQTAKLAFIVNVVLNEKKEIICAVAGDAKKAHEEGVRFLSSLCMADAVDANVAITTNGGYPLDQNMYQAVKGMTTAEATVRRGGVIIMLAQSGDGVGGDHFYHQLADEPDIHKTMAVFLARDRRQTVPDQWQTQIFLRVLMHASVVFVSDMDDETVRNMHMIPAHSIDEALQTAKRVLGGAQLRIAAIPDGVSVMIRKRVADHEN